MKYKTNFKSIQKEFHSSMLKQGEMMEITLGVYTGQVIMRTYDSLVSLTNADTWNQNATLIGRKLLPGESITLVQE